MNRHSENSTDRMTGRNESSEKQSVCIWGYVCNGNSHNLSHAFQYNNAQFHVLNRGKEHFQ